ncbi:2-C-methyl-D-erythritol 4-phosphate cytidylyltransferase [Paenibacillus cellulosilyticus]|uniref:2-C-methyl-D-erythritol 4-phosphate cytidylyltransferase n=1 Tax=Paenibacillus cellulosilyticus TaxID=375489 RepID=A0A2V2YZN0_9BACL|nr:IspD/TarI family cytidylyltransferase [Paenibacillus cellulosilyticus]PWW08335.1 2-C-methyl-D-erythritol 4-phosphate cytidylyltransferase [Paenibacillus cellulosilyticus]QKS47934.1 2-C-methyl-D-erythritol 4-phosphate cytidylyltransferase [Paenibacillus cellulosilyticus]
MNTALIFAGGTGQRMNTYARPKQFLELHGKPIILYTLEHFERHPEIDNIVVVCLSSWIDELKLLLRRYDIEKVSQIVPGGETGHDSIYRGLRALTVVCQADDIVLIHDGVRPLITKELISTNIAKAKMHGTAITVEPAIESVIQSSNGDQIDGVPRRASMYTAKAPQTFRFALIWEYYQRAHNEGMLTIDSAHLLSLFNVEMHMVKSPPNNMKITTPTDFYIFRALHEAIENQQILGI